MKRPLWFLYVVSLSIVATTAAAGNYTKIANDGSFLPLTALQGPGSTDWGCTQDNDTGLVWEVKRNDAGLHDKGNSYSWYNPDDSTNGGNAGTQNGGSCNGSDCDTTNYVTAVNNLGLCGGNDWYVPTIDELQGLVHCSNGTIPTIGNSCGTSGTYASPTIETDFFPLTDVTQYWSSSTLSYQPSFAWGINFDYGGYDLNGKGSYGAVRLVRGVQVVNAAPTVSVIEDQKINADTSIEIAFTVGDQESTAESLTVSARSSNTTLIHESNITFGGSGENRTVLIVPEVGQSGTATISIMVNDGYRSESVLEHFSIVVNAIPLAEDGSDTIEEDQDASGTLNATDIEEVNLDYTITSGPTHVTVTLEGGRGPGYIYTPNPHYHGVDSFQFSASDGSADSAAATITLTVNSVNDIPVAEDGSDTIEEDQDASGTLVATDIEEVNLDYTITSAPTHGTVTLEGGRGPGYIYTPNPHYHGVDSFQFSASDGSAGSTPATVTITVNSVNDAPTISLIADTMVVTGLQFSFIPEVYDLDNDSLDFSVTNLPDWLTLNRATGAITGTPTLIDVGHYSNIVFNVSDGIDAVSSAPFSLEVTDIDQLTITPNSELSPPSKLVLSQQNGNSLSLNWDEQIAETESAVLGYRIDRLDESGAIKATFYTEPSVTTYTDNRLTPLTTYSYRLSAFDQNGVSESLEVSGITKTLISNQLTTTTLTVHGGWNFIHLPQQTTVSDLKRQIPEIEAVWGMNNCSKVWEYTLFDGDSTQPITGSTITLLEPGRGYWINLADVEKKEQVSAEIEGRALTSAISLASVALYSGWNSIGISAPYLFSDAELPDPIDTIWGWEKYWMSFVDGVPPFLNSLQQLEKTKGYFVYQDSLDNEVDSCGDRE